MHALNTEAPFPPLSFQVRPVGVTKGLAMQRLVGLIAVEGGLEAAAFDYVLCIGGSVDGRIPVRKRNILSTNHA